MWDKNTQQPQSVRGIDLCLKCIITIAFITVLSLASIFIFDLVTQSALLNIKSIEISGAHRVLKEDIVKLAGLNEKKNIFSINLFSTEKRIASHPWIQAAKVSRKLSTTLYINVIEQEPMAIVKIENLADLIINTEGRPFKEYDPLKDHLGNLPVISGLDLTHKENQYMFNGPLFNSILDLLKSDAVENVKKIIGDKNTGLMIESLDHYNKTSSLEQQTIRIKLGFNNFKAKLKKAKIISEYVDKNFPERTICTMDLYNIEKVFIKTKLNDVTDALHNNLKKGV
jgi:cell division protein FtsQ